MPRSSIPTVASSCPTGITTRPLVGWHPSLPEAADLVGARYRPELTRLRDLIDSSPRYGMTVGQRGLLDRLLARADDIAATYPQVSGERHRGEATTLAGFDDDRYDATLCGWLMVHLEPEDERRVMVEHAARHQTRRAYSPARRLWR
ncbi:MAG: hypothetical protein JRI68_12300 [Deltaproteobacteria bacterium]|nr:hypothetical protein [Deltaproteobacteria bacterium]